LKLELTTDFLFSNIGLRFKVYGDTKGTNACGQDGSVYGILETTSLVEAGTEPWNEICCRPKSENGEGKFDGNEPL